MRALVGEDAAAFAGPCGAPAAGFVVGVGAEPIGCGDIDAKDFAKFAGGEKLFRFLHSGEGAEIEDDAKGCFGVVGVGFEHTFGITFGDGEWFFGEGGHACVHSVDGDDCVEVVRGCDDNGICDLSVD